MIRTTFGTAMRVWLVAAALVFPHGPWAVTCTADDPAAENLDAEKEIVRKRLRSIAQALLVYESQRSELPSSAISDAKGKPLLSWRVAILPYVEELRLFQEFRRNEPWDSEHNKKFLEAMPAVYASPGAKAGMTRFLVPTGAGTLFPDPGVAVKRTAVTDGLPETIAVVEVEKERAVPWTKPDDLPIDFAAPLVGLKAARPPGFLAVFGNVQVHEFRDDTPLPDLAAAFSIAGGEKPEFATVLTAEAAARLVARADTLAADEKDPVRFLDLQDRVTLPADAAKVLAGYKGDSINLSGVTALSADAARALAAFQGQKLGLNGVTNLSADAAKALATLKGCKELRLMGLQTLSVDTARGLAEFKGRELYLNGVTTLSAETARALAAFGGEEIVLFGLTDLSTETVAALAEFKGRELVFMSPKTLSADMAKAYAGFKTRRLRLNNLTSLSDDAARELAAFQGDSLDLNVPTLSPDAARALASFGGDQIILSALTDVSMETAAALAEFDGHELRLSHATRLERLSDDAAEALMTCKVDRLNVSAVENAAGRRVALTPAVARLLVMKRLGHSLVLSAVTALDTPDAVEIATILATSKIPVILPNLEKVSPKTLSALIKGEDVQIPLIETLKLIPEPDGSATEDFVIPEGFKERQRK